MKKYLKTIKLLRILKNPRKFFSFYLKFEQKEEEENLLYKNFNQDLQNFNKKANEEKRARIEFVYPCLYDKTTKTKLDATYFYQDSWAFEQIIKNAPSKHIDIGSHHKFVAHLSKVVDLTMVDIRPLSLPMESIKFIKGSIINLPFKDNSIGSLSSLCVIEHIGLGRYGDPIDPEGSEKALKEIYRILKKGGNFYLSVPVSDKYITRFNAGVIFEKNQFVKRIKQNYIIDNMMFIANSQLTDKFSPDDNFGTTLLLALIKK